MPPAGSFNELPEFAPGPAASSRRGESSRLCQIDATDYLEEGEVAFQSFDWQSLVSFTKGWQRVNLWNLEVFDCTSGVPVHFPKRCKGKP